MKKSNTVFTVQDEIINACNSTPSINEEPKIVLKNKKKSFNFFIYLLVSIILFILTGIIFVLINVFGIR